MKKKSQEPTQLLEPQLAIHAYLDALLSEVPETDEMQEASEVEAVAEAPEQLPQDVEVTAKPVDQEVTVAPEAQMVTDVNEHPAILNRRGASDEEDSLVIPSWAEGEFQSLCFKVAGVTLATPLTKLNGIVELKEELTELPGYAPWVMGILTTRGQQIQVVDLAHIILPESRKTEADNARSRVNYVILVNDGKFGLAADSLSQVINLRTDEVRWRTDHSRRPWLAGMAIEKMCAILDIEHLTRQMAQDDKHDP